jgi:hypothetical protein
VKGCWCRLNGARVDLATMEPAAAMIPSPDLPSAAQSTCSRPSTSAASRTPIPAPREEATAVCTSLGRSGLGGEGAPWLRGAGERERRGACPNFRRREERDGSVLDGFALLSALLSILRVLCFVTALLTEYIGVMLGD